MRPRPRRPPRLPDPFYVTAATSLGWTVTKHQYQKGKRMGKKFHRFTPPQGKGINKQNSFMSMLREELKSCGVDPAGMHC